MKYVYTVIKERTFDEQELKTFSSHKKAINFIESLIGEIDTISEIDSITHEKNFYYKTPLTLKTWTKKLNQHHNLNNIHYYHECFYQKEIYKIKVIEIF